MAKAKKSARRHLPTVMPIEFEWSADRWVATFVPGPSDIGMIVILHHDAAELERVVAGLVAFREKAAGRVCMRAAA
jgi:hypothetical protein